MTIANVITNLGKAARQNSPAILAGIGVAGSVTTAYLAAKAGYQAAVRLENAPPEISPREKLEKTWDLYFPAIASGTVTVTAIVVGTRISSKRAAAAASVLAISERALEEYREKVVEVIGEKEDQKVRDLLAQEKVNKQPPDMVFSDGDNRVICCDLHTMRYFKSDMESLRSAVNTINERINSDRYVCLTEFYYALDLDPTSSSDDFGWSERLLELSYSTALTHEGKPCITFDFNYLKPI